MASVTTAPAEAPSSPANALKRRSYFVRDGGAGWQYPYPGPYPGVSYYPQQQWGAPAPAPAPPSAPAAPQAPTVVAPSGGGFFDLLSPNIQHSLLNGEFFRALIEVILTLGLVLLAVTRFVL